MQGVKRNDIESARAWLLRARNAQREIDQLERTAIKAREMLTKITGNGDGTPVVSSPDPHKFDGLAALTAEVESQTNRLLAIQAETLEVIGRIPDGRLRTVLRLRYVDCETIEQTAVDAHYSYKHTRRLLARGLEQVAIILRDELQKWGL